MQGHSDSSTPTTDTTSDLQDATCSENGAEIICEFKRLLSTGDSQDTEFSRSSRVPLIWAHGALSSGTPSAHSTTSTDRGASSIQYSGALSEMKMIVAAAILMASLLF